MPRCVAMAEFHQLTIWDILDELSSAPPDATLDVVWECFDLELPLLTIEQQLEAASLAFVQIADILKARSLLLLEETRDSNSDLGPVVDSDFFAGLVRMSMHLDLDDLKEAPLPQRFQPHGAHNYPIGSDSVAAPVDKDNVLEMLQAVESWDDIRNLAGNEDVESWRQKIFDYIVCREGAVRLVELPRVLGLALVEVWLGLLLGDFKLEQRGEFYDVDEVFVQRIERM